MRKKFLIGFTKDYNIIVAELELRDQNFENELSCSFDESSIINANETVYNEDYIYDYIDSMLGGYDAEYRLELCERYDCSPQNLCDKMTEIYLNNPEEMKDLIDCSCYSKEISINDVDYIFRADAYGQHDTRDNLLYAIDNDLYNDIHYLWDNYHLKQLDEKNLELYDSIIERASKIDEEEEIKKFIEEYKEEIDEKTW